MTTLTIVMVYFPLIIVGLGQVLILGTSPAGRTLQDAAKARAWRSVRANRYESSSGQGEIVDNRATARLLHLPVRPVASLPRI